MPIRFMLDELLDAREMSGYALAQRTKMTPSAIYKLREKKYVDRLNGDTLEKLCEALECTPADLLVYEPPKKKRGH